MEVDMPIQATSIDELNPNNPGGPRDGKVLFLSTKTGRLEPATILGRAEDPESGRAMTDRVEVQRQSGGGPTPMLVKTLWLLQPGERWESTDNPRGRGRGGRRKILPW